MLKLNSIEYESHLALGHVSSDFHSVFFFQFSQFFFAHPINLKGLVVFLYFFQRLIHIFKDDFTKFQDNFRTKGTFCKFQEFFQDYGQIQGLFQVCASPDVIKPYRFLPKYRCHKSCCLAAVMSG